MQRPLAGLTAVVFSLAAVPAAAQQFLGRVGGACTALPSSNQQFVPLDAAVPPGSTLVVTVAASSNFVSDLQVGDAAGSRYQALGGMRNGAGGMVVHYRAALQRPLGIGQNLLVQYGNAGSGVQSCVSVLGYRGIPTGSLVQQALGAASGQSATPAVGATAASVPSRQLVLASFAFNAQPGSVTAQPPASSLPALCAAGSTLCLLDGHYFDNGGATASLGVTLGSPIAWTGALTALYADGIFGNGFD